MAAVNEESRLDLNNALRDLQLTGEIALDRDLVERVLDHRPLWLASVLGSPKRIDLHDGLFDLVIFDEASQCDIASALPLLARAHRAVVVGDDRQLAFIPQIGSAQDRNLMAAQGLPSRGMGRFAQGRVSLFDFARSTPNVPAIMLRDQYRSSSDIVGYINEQFYGGKLRVSADLDRLKVPEGSRSSLAWNHVTGQVLTGVRNVNPAEVEAIRTHLKRILMDQGYGGTVGVIAPFRTQVHAIETALRETLPVDLVERSGLRSRNRGRLPGSGAGLDFILSHGLRWKCAIRGCFSATGMAPIKCGDQPGACGSAHYSEISTMPGQARSPPCRN